MTVEQIGVQLAAWAGVLLLATGLILAGTQTACVIAAGLVLMAWAGRMHG